MQVCNSREFFTVSFFSAGLFLFLVYTTPSVFEDTDYKRRLIGIDAVGRDPGVVDVVSPHFTAMTDERHFKRRSGRLCSGEESNGVHPQWYPRSLSPQ